MSEFINTIDVLGDDELCDQFISKTMTEFCDDQVVKIGGAAFYKQKSLKTVDCPNAETIDGSAFYDCSMLETANFPKATTASGDALFYGCSALHTVNLPLLTSVGSDFFRSCVALKSVNLPKVTSIGTRGFYVCDGLEEVNAKAVTTLGSNAFRGCDKLLSADFPLATEIGGDVFYGCSSLETVNMPLLTTTGNFAFRDAAITEANFPQLATISYGAFQGCANLASVNLPEATKIGNSAFWGNKALKEACFPKVVSIDNDAFNGTTVIEKIDLPVATSIGSTVFYHAYANHPLHTLILRSETMCTLANVSSLNHTQIAKGTGYIYVPRALVDTYKAATNWSTYAAQFRALEDYTVDGTITGELDDGKVSGKGTWEAIQASMEAGTHATDYAIGDTVTLNLGDEGIVKMQIAAFDTDNLADGSGKAKITWISKGLLATSRRMNPARVGSSGAYTEGTGGVGGWEKSELRSVLKNTIKPLIPTAVQNMIAEVTKSQRTYNTAGTYSTQTTTEDVWLPSTDELSYGIYMGLFPDNDSRLKYRQDGTKANWWTRDAASTSTFYYVDGGNPNSSTATANTYGVALSFCTN